MKKIIMLFALALAWVCVRKHFYLGVMTFLQLLATPFLSRKKTRCITGR